MTSANARLRVVEDHARFESTHELGPLVATFGDSPEWHNQAGEQVLHGHDAIRGFYADLFQGFPDFSLDLGRKHEAKDSIVVEGTLRGTHRATWMGMPATGKTIAVPFCAVFTFTPDDRIKAEIVYYDRVMLLTQLGVLNLPG
jgi:steroid delta-isomerase-like uncharacterized protein